MHSHPDNCGDICCFSPQADAASVIASSEKPAEIPAVAAAAAQQQPVAAEIPAADVPQGVAEAAPAVVEGAVPQEQVRVPILHVQIYFVCLCM